MLLVGKGVWKGKKTPGQAQSCVIVQSGRHLYNGDVGLGRSTQNLWTACCKVVR